MPRRTGDGSRLLAAALAVAALLAPVAARAGARVEARVDRSEIALGEILTLEIRVEASERPDGIVLPEQGLEFDVVSRAETRQSSVSLGGGAGVQIRDVRVYTLGLSPRRAGALTIPPVVARIGSERVATEPLIVVVRPRGAAPTPPPVAGPPAGPDGPPQGAGWRGWERDLALVVEVDRREAYVGEQVTASVLIVSPLPVVRTADYRSPSYDGAWAERLELADTLVKQLRTVNGVPLLAYRLERVALFPTRPGTLSLDPCEALVSVELRGHGFFDPYPEVAQVRRRSAPVKITVKPLPPGAPPGFDPVNVGKLALSVEVPQATTAPGQAVTVRISASGEGNVHAWSLPTLPPIPGTRAFAPAPSDEVKPRNLRLAGTRRDEVVLLPDGPGELRVPPLAWSWFDPSTGRYETTRTAEVAIRVGPGPGPGGGAAPPPVALRPIASAARLARVGAPPWRSAGFAAALALPVLGYLGWAAAGRLRARRGADAGARRVRRASAAARRRLEQARQRIAAGDRDALAEVQRALVGYASDKLGRPAAGLARAGLGAALAEAGAHAPAIRAALAALDACDAARYGRAAADAPDVVAAAERAIALLDEADWGDGEAG